jgi:hypothetical protein
MRHMPARLAVRIAHCSKTGNIRQVRPELTSTPQQQTAHSTEHLTPWNIVAIAQHHNAHKGSNSAAIPEGPRYVNDMNKLPGVDTEALQNPPLKCG